MGIKILLIFIVLINSVYAYTINKKYKITILHTNDNHGRYWKNRHGEYGMAARYTLIRKLRKQVKKTGGYSLLLSGGDVNTGVPESDLLLAEPDFIGMNKLKYDAMAVGNHEFDNPLSIIRKQEAWAGFPFLSANIFYEPKNKLMKFVGRERVFAPFLIKELDGLRISILGLTTLDTPLKTNIKNTKGIAFDSPIDVSKKLVPYLKNRSDIVLALTHMGHFENGNHGSNSPGDVTLARQVDGIDLIVGGHSQKALFKPDIQNGTIIVQAYEWGKYVGKVDLEFLNGELKLVSSKLIPVNLKKKIKTETETKYELIEDEIVENKKVLSLLEPYKIKGEKKILFDVGTVDETFVGDKVVLRSKEAAIGNLISKAFMEKTNADVAIMNAGGIRNGLEKGNIRYKDILNVHPFGGQLCIVVMTGKELKDYIKKVIIKMVPGTGGFLHSWGLKLIMKDNIFEEFLIQGKPVDEEKNYKLTLPEFVATGGDGYPRVDRWSSFSNTGYPEEDALRSYFEKYRNIKRSDFLPRNSIQIK